eukprot:TRINITY_DN5908_c0_g1_i3.p1 TRINITY_DN5908_c0_g1~~TRINITY_DN5908_c0_g1_i3.p1  ORF type:complete len:146 (+),score=26.72 TRINITY_DN5908_c0_g1_i3:487-924(+)
MISIVKKYESQTVFTDDERRHASTDRRRENEVYEVQLSAMTTPKEPLQRSGFSAAGLSPVRTYFINRALESTQRRSTEPPTLSASLAKTRSSETRKKFMPGSLAKGRLDLDEVRIDIEKMRSRREEILGSIEQRSLRLSQLKNKE